MTNKKTYRPASGTLSLRKDGHVRKPESGATILRVRGRCEDEKYLQKLVYLAFYRSLNDSKHRKYQREYKRNEYILKRKIIQSRQKKYSATTKGRIAHRKADLRWRNNNRDKVREKDRRYRSKLYPCYVRQKLRRMGIKNPNEDISDAHKKRIHSLRSIHQFQSLLKTKTK